MKYAHSSCYDGGMENNLCHVKVIYVWSSSDYYEGIMKESVDLEKGMEKVK
jgi:hypothetical protein